MELMDNFIHEQETTEKVYDPEIGGVKDVKGRVLVFPRYHQLDVIRELKATIVAEGCWAQLPDPAHHRERQVKLHRMVSTPAHASVPLSDRYKSDLRLRYHCY